jgi:hypothetical protein
VRPDVGWTTITGAAQFLRSARSSLRFSTPCGVKATVDTSPRPRTAAVFRLHVHGNVVEQLLGFAEQLGDAGEAGQGSSGGAVGIARRGDEGMVKT